MNEQMSEQQPINHKQKTVLIVLSMVAVCLIISAVLVFWVLPNVLRARFKLAYVDLIKQYSEQYELRRPLRRRHHRGHRREPVHLLPLAQGRGEREDRGEARIIHAHYSRS